MKKCCFVCIVSLYKVEAATDSESESKGSREYHSVGIQVEDDKKGWDNDFNFDVCSHWFKQQLCCYCFYAYLWSQPAYSHLWLLFNCPSDRAGLNAPTVWRQLCRRTWSWRVSPPWRTRACSLVGVSSGTRSLARPPSMERCEPYAPRGSSATGRITVPLLNPRAPGRRPARPPGSWNPPPLGRAQPLLGSRAGHPPPCVETGVGSCSCSTPRPRGLRAGAKRWRQKLKKMTCQRNVSVQLKVSPVVRKNEGCFCADRHE